MLHQSKRRHRVHPRHEVFLPPTLCYCYYPLPRVVFERRNSRIFTTPRFLIITLIKMVTFSVLLFLALKYFTYKLYTFQAWRSLNLIQLFRNVPSRCDDGDDSFFHDTTISINRRRPKIFTILLSSVVQILSVFLV